MYQVDIKLMCHAKCKEEAEQIVTDCRSSLPYIEFDECEIIPESEQTTGKTNGKDKK